MWNHVITVGDVVSFAIGWCIGGILLRILRHPK